MRRLLQRMARPTTSARCAALGNIALCAQGLASGPRGRWENAFAPAVKSPSGSISACRFLVCNTLKRQVEHGQRVCFAGHARTMYLGRCSARAGQALGRLEAH